MGYRLDFNSSPELKNSLLEILTIGFMALAWTIFILSTKNYENVYWYPWLFYSRISMSLIGFSLASLIALKKVEDLNLSSWYLLLSVGIQASHGFFEGEKSVDFYNFIGIVFVLSCISYNGTLRRWIKTQFPFHASFFTFPLFFKNNQYFASVGTFIDSFSLMIAGLIIGIAILKINASRYQYILKYLESKKEVIKLACQVAHDIRSPVTALRIAHENIQCEINESELIHFSLDRIEEIANNLLHRYRDNNCEKENSFIDDLEQLINEKRLTNNSIQFKVTYHPSLKYLTFMHARSDLNRVLSNLLNNSLEAIGTAEGIIHINFIAKDTNYFLSITDNGKGIPQSVLKCFQDKIFSYDKKKGNGLGLNHAKDFLNDLKGSLTIDSQEGQGTCIKLNFPQSTFKFAGIPNDHIN